MKSTLTKMYLTWILVLASAISIALANTVPPDGRIVGGWETSIRYFPHQVSLQLFNRHICGASIIKEDLVLTAAHCVARYNNPQLFMIRAGSSYHYKAGVLIQVQDIKIHEDYGLPGKNDIALLKLAQPLTYNLYIQPIAVMEENATEIQELQKMWVTGWGAQESSVQQMSPVLRFTVVNKMNWTKCQESYKIVADLTSDMLCAGIPQGGKDSCQGDSGGPLIAKINNSMKLVGIVSFGIGCGQANYPGVYTRVQNYHSWLNKTIEAL